MFHFVTNSDTILPMHCLVSGCVISHYIYCHKQKVTGRLSDKPSCRPSTCR